VALLKDPALPDEALFSLLPGPDFPGGGQIISAAADIQEIYRSGRGSLKVRARWTIEELARGQWQLVVSELPPGVSAQRVLQEIDELTNPKVRPGKKALTAEQLQLKASLLAVLDGVRDEAGKDAPVRLVFEPRSSRIDPQALLTQLLAHTSLECSVPVNLTVVGLDGKPVAKSLREILQEWIAFRQQTIERRSRHRLEQVRARIHILQGRQIVLLNVDEVIAIIRQSDEPRAALMARFALSERQADDILEIRLRQLARLEAIKIEQELVALHAEQASLEDVLANPASLRRLMAREIEADAKTFGDARRTLIQPDRKAVADIRVVDEPVTVIVSARGWVRARTGHGHDAAAFSFKAGDALYGAFECRSVDTLIVLGSDGRSYSVPVASLPGARGDGQPITTLIDLEPGTQPVHYLAGPPASTWLLAASSGYGFTATIEAMSSRVRGGKAFVSLAEGETLCPPAPVQGHGRWQWRAIDGTVVSADATAEDAPPAIHVCCVSSDGHILSFALDAIKALPKGGRGLQLMALTPGARLVGAVPYLQRVWVEGLGRGNKPRSEVLDARVLQNALAARARKGRDARFGFTPQRLMRLV
jgi:topoisomerase-4 subunit A